MSNKLTSDILKKMILEEKEKISTDDDSPHMGAEYLKKLILKERLIRRKLALVSRTRKLLEKKLRRKS